MTPNRILYITTIHFLKTFLFILNKEKVSIKKSQKLEVVNAQACGIDVGSRSHFVAIGQGSADVKEFGIYTEDHRALIKHLKEINIKSIAMESTSVSLF